jgi:hypothetical protein
MLRITIHHDAESLTFQFEGTLVGPWVREAEACWQQTLADQQSTIRRLDLRGVTAIDAAGKGFLKSAHTQGADLVACGCLMRAIVAAITHTAAPDCR